MKLRYFCKAERIMQKETSFQETFESLGIQQKYADLFRIHTKVK